MGERESAIMLCIKHLLSASMEGRNECKKKEGNISIYIYIHKEREKENKWKGDKKK